MSDQQADWAWLPGDIMDVILKKLGSIEDCLRVSQVCVSWFSHVKDHIQFNRHKRAPLLVIPAKNNRRDKRNLYSVIDDKTYDAQLDLHYNRRCCGSSHGWLATVGKNMIISLTNPFSQRRIRLPQIFNPPKGNHKEGDPISFYMWIYKVILSDDPDSSPEKCVVGAIYGGLDELAFIKLDDKCWTYVHGNLTMSSDIIFSNGLLYAMDRHGKLISVDISIDSNVGKKEVEVIVPRRMSTQAHMAYVVESRNGDILMIRRLLVKQPEHEDLYLTRDIMVFKLQRHPSKHSEWIEINDLNGETFFVGDSHSTSLSSSEIPGLKPNCIYYTDDYFHDGQVHYQRHGPVDAGVFDMKKGSFESHYVLDPSHKQFPPAIFIMASYTEIFSSFNSSLVSF